MSSKQCGACCRIKYLDEYSYIPKLRKHRHHCKECVRRENALSKSWAANFFQQHGLTPSIHAVLTGKADSMAFQKGWSMTFACLPESVRQQFNRTDRHKFNTSLSMVLFVASLFYLSWSTFLIPLFAGATFAAMIIKLGKHQNKFYKPVMARIQGLKADLSPGFFEQLKAERLIYEVQPRTAEWRMVQSLTVQNSMLSDGSHLCYLCGDKIARKDLTVDHVLPRSLYPQLANDPKNLKVAHRSCNSIKGTRVLTKYVP